MKVYVLLQDSACDFDQDIDVLGVFDTGEKARAALENTLKTVIERDFNGTDFISLEEADDEMDVTGEWVRDQGMTYCELYVMGYYATDHYCLKIVEKELN